MTSFGVWWIEIVAAVTGVMCLALVIREATAFLSVRRLRQRDGGTPVPRTKDEYLLLFPKACPRCLSRGGKQVKGWHVDRLGASEFIETWQCAECAYVEGGNRLSPMREAEITEQSVKAGQRWFISTVEAERIQRPRLAPQDFEPGSDGETLPPRRG
jgi:hypothetical protein